MQLSPRLNELFEQHIRQFLVEMNVANLDQIRQQFSQMFVNAVQHRGVQLAAGLRDFLIKRAVKAMQNDEQGHMVTRRQLDQPPENAPAWLVTAIESGQPVYDIEFKEGFQDRLQHVVDWLAADQTAERVVRATPEEDFLGRLAEFADRFFANKSAQEAPTETHSGELIEMTFRTNPGTEQVLAYKENSIAPDKARGDVVAFWAELTTAEALDREGKLMGHCVGSYADLVRSQHVRIYSLRDARNQPHVTLEVNQRHGGKNINQIKGKRNQPPIGKYAPYVRDFLNDLGISPSDSGRNDLKGMGLLSHKGKFGTIAEIGGDILYTFQNGDTLRTIEGEDEERSIYGYRTRVESDTKTYWYVERIGTVPFKLSMRMVKKQDENAVSGLTILRQEVGRYPVFAANLIKYLNENHITSWSATVLEQFDVFYDKVKGLWGKRDDLTEVMFSHDGITVSRLADTAYFAHGDTLLASADLTIGGKGGRIYGLSKLKVINDTAELRALPAVMTAFAEKFLDAELYSLMTDNEKDTIRGFGLTRRTKQGYRSVPEDKTILSTKHGSIRYEANRLYFYTKSGVLLASVYTAGSKENTGIFDINGRKLFLFGSENRREVYQLISDLGQSSIKSMVDDFDYGEYYRHAAEAGFFQKNKKLVPLTQVVFSQKIPDGYTVSSEVGEDHHNQSVKLLKRNREILVVWVDDNDQVKRINMPSARPNQEESLAKYREQLAMLLNVAKLQVRRKDMLAYCLQERNGRFYPQTDKRVIELYTTQHLDLGDGFVFRMTNSGTYYGQIEVIDSTTDYSRYRYGSTVVYVNWDNDEHQELTYKMVKDRHLRDYYPSIKATRSQIIRVTGKFQQFFHDKIEPYLSDELVGGGTRRQ